MAPRPVEAAVGAQAGVVAAEHRGRADQGGVLADRGDLVGELPRALAELLDRDEGEVGPLRDAQPGEGHAEGGGVARRTRRSRSRPPRCRWPALTDSCGAARTSVPVSVWRTTIGWASCVPGAISSSIGCGAKARLRSTKASSDGSTGSADGGWSASLTSRRPTPAAERLELTGYPFDGADLRSRLADAEVDDLGAVARGWPTPAGTARGRARRCGCSATPRARWRAARSPRSARRPPGGRL